MKVRISLIIAVAIAIALTMPVAAVAGLSPRGVKSNFEQSLASTRTARPLALPTLQGPLRISSGVPNGADRPARSRVDDPNQQAFPITWSGFYRLPIVGKVYFNMPGEPSTSYNHICTGTMVAANIVLTAAHCIWDSETGDFVDYHLGWKFIPSQWGGEAPYGAWFANEGWVPDDYQNTRGQYLPDDYGFLVLKPNNAGQNAGNVVGAATIVANAVPGAFWAFGYAAAGWFGQYQYKGERGTYSYSVYAPYSDSWTYTLGTETGYTIGMGNYETGGASGGPWFGPYNGQWNNYVYSVNSHCWAPPGTTPGGRCNDSPDPNSYSRNMWGPYFTTDTLDALAYVKTLSP